MTLSDEQQQIGGKKETENKRNLKYWYWRTPAAFVIRKTFVRARSTHSNQYFGCTCGADKNMTTEEQTQQKGGCLAFLRSFTRLFSGKKVSSVKEEAGTTIVSDGHALPRLLGKEEVLGRNVGENQIEEAVDEDQTEEKKNKGLGKNQTKTWEELAEVSFESDVKTFTDETVLEKMGGMEMEEQVEGDKDGVLKEEQKDETNVSEPHEDAGQSEEKQEHEETADAGESKAVEENEDCEENENAEESEEQEQVNEEEVKNMDCENEERKDGHDKTQEHENNVKQRVAFPRPAARDDENAYLKTGEEKSSEDTTLPGTAGHKGRDKSPLEAAARPQVLEALLSPTVPAEYRQMLLGEGACVLRALQEQYLVQIQQDDCSGNMTLRGYAHNVDRCFAAMEKIITTWQWWDALHSAAATPTSAAGDTQVADAKDSKSLNISFSDFVKDQHGPTRPTYTPKKAVMRWTVYVPAQYRKRIMGKNGRYIACLRNDYRIQISYDLRSGEMNLHGLATSVKHCHGEVIRVLTRWQYQDSQWEPWWHGTY